MYCRQWGKVVKMSLDLRYDWQTRARRFDREWLRQSVPFIHEFLTDIKFTYLLTYLLQPKNSLSITCTFFSLRADLLLAD